MRAGYGDHRRNRYADIYITCFNKPEAPDVARGWVLIQAPEKALCMTCAQTQRNEVHNPLPSTESNLQSPDSSSLISEILTAQAAPTVERRRRSRVEQAKQEWEVTADSLPQLVLLLDGDGRVVRANYTVEKWNLCSVSSVHGKALHELLHPGCNDAFCTLGGWTRQAWRRIQEGAAVQCEIADNILARFIEIQVRPIVTARERKLPVESSHAVAIIHDISELKRAEEAARQINDELERRVEIRTQELHSVNHRLMREIEQHEQTENALQVSKSEAHLLSAQLLTAQEVERKRIAAELHDEVGQALSGIKICVERALRELSTENGSTSAGETLSTVIPMTQTVIEEVRRIAMNLRPSSLDDLGIRATLACFFRQYELIYPEFTIVKEIRLRECVVPKALKTVIYRLVQEAMNNVAKHARATKVVFSLCEHNGAIECVIEDNGIGYDPKLVQAKADASHCMGLSCMRERIEFSGGQLKVSTRSGFGTEIRVTWPCARAQGSRSRKRNDDSAG